MKNIFFDIWCFTTLGKIHEIIPIFSVNGQWNLYLVSQYSLTP